LELSTHLDDGDGFVGAETVASTSLEHVHRAVIEESIFETDEVLGALEGIDNTMILVCFIFESSFGLRELEVAEQFVDTEDIHTTENADLVVGAASLDEFLIDASPA
jgi:hypothetical protein